MNIKKIEKQLKKINQLFDTIKEDGNASIIERDLMLSYIRGLYEKMIKPQDDSSVNVAKPKKARSKSKAKPPKAEKFIPQTEDVAAVVMKEVAEADQQRGTSIPASNHVEAIAPTRSPQETVVQEVAEVPKPQVPEELAELFKFQSANELSDKLSRAPIADLTKSMGINEKIFTEQELFGGDSNLFSTTMESLDKMSSLDEARDYLVEHVAIDQNWSSEEKIKKAANFIKHISRRY